MLAERIESETIDGNPESRPLAAFFDKWDIDRTQSLIDRMNAGMAESRHLIAVLSPEFLRAEWPRFEWKHNGRNACMMRSGLPLSPASSLPGPQKKSYSRMVFGIPLLASCERTKTPSPGADVLCRRRLAPHITPCRNASAPFVNESAPDREQAHRLGSDLNVIRTRTPQPLIFPNRRSLPDSTKTSATRCLTHRTCELCRLELHH